MNRFIFKSYDFDKANLIANFYYAYEDGKEFKESVQFETGGEYDEKLLDRALFLAFIILGTSYYKSYPSKDIVLDIPIDDRQAAFFNKVYQEGLSQFAFENNLTRDDLAHFESTSEQVDRALRFEGSGILVLQSGGKDSLLTSSLLQENAENYTSFYLSSSGYFPRFLEQLDRSLIIGKRFIDIGGLRNAINSGAKNGHVPVTYINQSLAVIQAILSNKNIILTSIAHEGEEPHSYIGDLPVNHQWSKTWIAEQLLASYVTRYISLDIKIGSMIRCYSELRVAELFIEHAWVKYGRKFSSCNQANYKQGDDNSELVWCGNCPKCANSYLLFAAFLPSEDLKPIFGEQDLFVKPQLQQIFKGMLGIDNESKPFECVGEIEELRYAYQLAQSSGGYQSLSFEVPPSNFDYMRVYPSQGLLLEMIQ